ncbi:hypothetical protein ACFQT0_01470 [Hymenobacter humi]|uniref:Uncharacterized protein n=1 Tax=Hymenobacter humi TaxID=1411620 RepID=A0ABW2TYE8_9BACT
MVACSQVEHLELRGHLLLPTRVLLKLGPHYLAAVHRQHFGDIELAGHEHAPLSTVPAEQH